MIVAAVVVIGALLVGIYLGRRNDSTRFADRPVFDELGFWAFPGDVLRLATIFVTLFVAFVLANAATGYSRAKVAAQTEAAVVDNLFETAAYTADPHRRRLQRAAVCYARAVAGPEWGAMAAGTGELSSVPSKWTGTGHNGIRRTLQQMGPDDVMFAALAATDQKRGDARRDRLAQARPKTPPLVIAFILLAIAALLLYHALVAHRRSPGHIAGSALSAATFLVAMMLVHSLDEPFSGPLRIGATEMTTTAHDVTADFADRYGLIRLRCDAAGKPTGSAA